MPEVSLRIPQIGEGLQEARLVAVLKQPGDAVRRDEPIYQMETDKAVMDVESPHDGTLVKWLAEPDTVLKIGAEVGVMRVQASARPAGPVVSEEAVERPVVRTAPQGAALSRRRDVPPRTRAYARSKGLTDEQIESVPASGSKLMPGDIDAFLSGQGASSAVRPTPAKPYVERAMSARQRVLMTRLQRGNQLVVPGMMAVVADWGPIESLRSEIKARGGSFQPSSFTMFAYCVAQAAKTHPVMRTTLVGDGILRTYERLQLGVAVALPGDDLVVAVIEDADALGWREFADEARAKIELARLGKDQATEATTLSITNMAGHGIRDAMAVVVPPGVITVFLGEPYTGLANVPGELRPQRCANIGITIDHRLINGVGGAEVLNSIKRNVESVREVIGE
jgi:pyruvate dehydrogenase E2 component (dihydrolipoamide acetyltransferase)